MRLARRYRLGGGVVNLTDENYYEVRGYNLPGRAVFIIGSRGPAGRVNAV